MPTSNFQWAPLRRVAFATALCAVATVAAAQKRDNHIGISVLGQSPVVIDADTTVLPVPTFRYERFFLEGGMLGVDLLHAQGFKLSAGALIAADGFDPDDAPALAGLQERKARVYAALAASYTSAYGIVSARVGGDVSDESKGTRARLGYQYPLQFGSVTLLPGAGVDWLDKKDARYLYGVSAAEATAGRPAYDPGAGFNPYVNLSAVWRLGGPHAITGFAQVQALDSAFKDSPIVDRRGVATLGVGYQYRF
jgi:MipA family protein